MKSANIETLMSHLYYLGIEEKKMVEAAYNFAKFLHDGQYRKSGEDYITHPLTVADILALMHADYETICAGLLHDVLEDTNTTKEQIGELFGNSIAKLVDGVTKMELVNFSSKQAQNYANIRKILMSIKKDIRTFIIKLADSLHNMSTLEYMKESKQKENARECRERYIPIAYHIGAYRIKKMLEDLTMKYLEPEEYKEITDIMKKVEEDNKEQLVSMIDNINNELNIGGIKNTIEFRMKNAYGIYERLNAGHSIYDIHDLLVLKVILENISDCYSALGLIHFNYPPINNKFKDYICNPKTNMYRSIHTTVFSPYDNLVQCQIRTEDMDKVASFGISAYWYFYNDKNCGHHMQRDLEGFQFFDTLSEIDATYQDDCSFVRAVNDELFSDKVYVCTPRGKNIELPKGATVVDFAYKIHTDLGNNMVGAYINDIYTTDFSYNLKNRDIVKIKTSLDAKGPSEEWYSFAKTTNANRKIKEFIKKK